MRHSQSFSIALCFALAVSWTPFRLAGDERKNLQDDSTANFARDVFPLLQRHCLECHGDKHEANLWLDGHQNLVDYRHQGREFRLTDVHGEIVRTILS